MTAWSDQPGRLAECAECACGCCETTAQTPVRVYNRAGLAAIRYRVGRHPEFLASLHAALTAAGRTALAKFTTRDPSDLTMALLDGVATVCDVLTFYTERLAQESYLLTATDRLSLQALGRLVAFRLRPGVAAETSLAFFVEPPRRGAPPPPDPFATAPYLSGAVEIPAGLAVRSVPGVGEEPQTFETVAPVVASPDWNALTPRRTRPVALGLDSREAYLTGTDHRLVKGDTLLFLPEPLPANVAYGDQGWAIRPVASVNVYPASNRTHVTWRDKLTANETANPLTLHVLRRRVPVFGHAAPRYGLLKPVQASPPPNPDDDWSNFSIGPSPSAGVQYLDLEGSHPDIAIDSWLVLDDGTFRVLQRVTAVTELSKASWMVSGRATRIPLDYDAWATFQTMVRTLVVYGVSEPLPLDEEPDPDDVEGGQIIVDGAVPPALPGGAGRTLLVAGTTTAGEAQVETVTLAAAASAAASPQGTPRTTLTLDTPMTGAYERSTVIVYGNVARATHGETVHQVLGDGVGSQRHQSFELRHTPLTYVSSDSADGATSSLRIRVGDVEWHEVPSQYQSGPAERSFVTRDSERGTTLVGFGDGLRGARLPTGQHNVRALHRKGIGTAGNVGVGALSQILAPPLGITKVTNPAAASGGVDPEGAAAGRVSIPLQVRTLGRAVSLTDYADFARAFASVAKASAAVLTLPGGPTVVVTVAGADWLEVPLDTRKRLFTSLQEHGDPHVRVVVMPARPVSFRLALTVRRETDWAWESVRAAVVEAVCTAYAWGARDLGAPVHRSAVVATVQSVPGVVGVDLDKLYRTDVTNPSLSDRLSADASTVVDGVPVGAELLAIDTDPFDWLAEMST